MFLFSFRFVQRTTKQMDTRALLESIQARASKATNVLAAFKDFTRQSNSHNGRVTREQFRTVCNQNGIPTSEQTVDALFNQLDLDGDGAIDYKEFVYGVLEGKVPVTGTPPPPRSPISDVRAKARRELQSNELTSSMIKKHFEVFSCVYCLLTLSFMELSMFVHSVAPCPDRPIHPRHGPVRPLVINAAVVKSNSISLSRRTCRDSASMYTETVRQIDL